MKLKELRRTQISLKNGLNEEVIVCDKKDDIAFAKKGKIYVNENFFTHFNLLEQKAVIYHERHHNTKEGKLFISLSDIFVVIGSLLIAIFLLNIILSLFKNIYSNLNLPLNISLFLITSGILFIGYSTLFRWFAETMSDANAIKNINKITFKNALNKAYDYYKKKRWLLKRIENDYLLHVPKRLRFRIIESWD